MTNLDKHRLFYDADGYYYVIDNINIVYCQPHVEVMTIENKLNQIIDKIKNRQSRNLSQPLGLRYQRSLCSTQIDYIKDLIEHAIEWPASDIEGLRGKVIDIDFLNILLIIGIEYNRKKKPHPVFSLATSKKKYIFSLLDDEDTLSSGKIKQLTGKDHFYCRHWSNDYMTTSIIRRSLGIRSFYRRYTSSYTATGQFEETEC